MNKQKTAIVVDSGCDVPVLIREKLHIKVLPLHIIYPEKDYQDSVDIDPMMVYERFPDEFPTTSTPSLAEVESLFEEIRSEGYENAIVVCISSGLSGTCNTVRLAASQTEGLNVFVLDSKNISIGAGLLAIWAARMLHEGIPYKQLIADLVEKVKDCKVFFYMDTLTYLRRGGRIGHVASTLGEVLKLKPIISCDEEGVYYTVAKIRGTKFAKIRLKDEVQKYCEGHKTWIVVEEGCAHEEAAEMVDILRKTLTDTRILFEQQITATMALNTGPGLVGVGIMREPLLSE